ncbi:MAG: hypothetical protein WA771_11855 [Chthoniobacterales bacterium]
MPPRKFPLSLTVGILFSTSLILPAAEPTPAELAALRQALAEIRANQEAFRSSAMSQSLSRLKQATGSPLAAINAYVEAVAIDQFGDEPGARVEFGDWRQDNSDLLASDAMRTAAILHLKYLSLTLNRAMNPDQPPNLDAIVGYIREAAAAQPLFQNPDDDRMQKDSKKQLRERIKSLTDEPLNKAPFVRAYNLGPLISGLKDWEMAPGKLNEMLNTTVRPILRTNEDPRLLETWDLQVEMTRGMASDWDRQQPESKLNSEQLPRLAWSKANDQIVLGDSAAAYQTMLRLIQTYPSHPDALKWIAQLSELVAPPETPAAPESAEQPAQTPTGENAPEAAAPAAPPAD